MQASLVRYSGADLHDSVAAYFHLGLAAATIAASWVGWGQSSYSLSNIRSPVSRDFVLLAIDLWLVVLYFFLARGVELPASTEGRMAVASPSLTNEKALIAWIFGTYLFWDVVTKPERGMDTTHSCSEVGRQHLVQR